MEENLKILKEIGAQKIHKDTHISKEHVQAIIHGSVEGLHPVQLSGFISILEREYDVDLSELKRQAKEQLQRVASSSERKVFVAPVKQKNNSIVYTILLIAIFLAAGYYSFVYLSSMATTEVSIDNSNIQSAQKSIEIIEKIEEYASEEGVEETNTTQAVDTLDEEVSLANTNSIEPEALSDPVEEPTAGTKTLKILPVNKIWAGYIMIETNQKYQKIFTDDFSMDTSKNWLLLFGSGTIYLEVNGEKKKYSSSQNMRFKYVDGVFTKITVAEFKELNKGRKW
mgnify:FL=1|jgi:hypothetical protein